MVRGSLWVRSRGRWLGILSMPLMGFWLSLFSV